ncbi:MAG: hypothetical protein AAFR47_22280 [Pseudomonadota bacterium]
MRERRWSQARPEPGDVIEGNGVRVRALEAGGATLISGDVAAGVAKLAPGSPVLGLLGELPSTATACLRIARDRGLLLSPAPLETDDGWNGAFATSAADDVYVELEIRGPKSGGLREACMAEPPTPSPSAAIQFAGHTCLVVREDRGLRVLVPRSEATGLWAMLDRTVRSL